MFISKVLLEHSHIHSCAFYYGCLCTERPELSSLWQRPYLCWHSCCLALVLHTAYLSIITWQCIECSMCCYTAVHIFYYECRHASWEKNSEVYFECHTLKAHYCLDYSSIELGGKALHLLCSDNIAMLKWYNIHHHSQAIPNWKSTVRKMRKLKMKYPIRAEFPHLKTGWGRRSKQRKK